MAAGASSSPQSASVTHHGSIRDPPEEISGSGLRVFARNHGEDSDGNGL